MGFIMHNRVNFMFERDIFKIFRHKICINYIFKHIIL